MNAIEDRLSWLAGEIGVWTKDGLVTEDQARRIRGRYDFAEVDVDRRAAAPGKLVTAILVMGALLVGAGILAFIASNWDGMSDAFRLALIFTTVAGLNGAGYELAFRRGTHPKVGQALLLTGQLAYGAGVFLVSQIFHIDWDWTTGFLLWGIGSLGVAAAVRSAPVFAVGAAAMAIWATGEAGDYERNQALSGIVLAAAVLPLAYFRKCPQHVGAAVLAIASWLALSPAEWTKDSEEMLPAAWLASAGLFWAIGLLHGERREFSLPWRLAAGFSGMLCLFALGFHGLAEELAPDAAREGLAPGHVVLLFMAAAAGAFALLRARTPLARLEAAASPVVAGLGAIWLLFVDSDHNAAFVFLANLTFFAAALGLVAAGHRERLGLLAYQGLGWFGLGLLCRYCEYGIQFIDKSVFFIVGGLLLLALGWALEGQRRKIAAVLREAHA